MVADKFVSKGRRLTGPEVYFCRLVAYEGKSATAAYRIAYKCAPKSAPELASRTMDRPHIIAKIEELRAACDREGQMQMAERRRLLAETARRKINEQPSHGERIAAIREDAILAGERRHDGDAPAGAITVNFLQMIAGASSTPIVVQPQPVAAEIIVPDGSYAGPSVTLPATSVSPEAVLALQSPLLASQPVTWNDE